MNNTKEIADYIKSAMKDCIFEELSPHNYEENLIGRLARDCDISFFDCGATKVVIKFCAFPDFVIKIPFEGSGGSDEYGEWFDRFTAANYYYYEDYSLEDWDYCAIESFLYSSAIDSHVEKYFAETAFLCDVNSFPIYIQPCCCTMKSFCGEADLSPSITTYSNSFKRTPAIWLNDFESAYGIEAVAALSHFINDFNIGDLHGGNVGYINDKPIIFDYGGFND